MAPELAPRYDLVLKGGSVATPAGLAEADIGVRSGRIVAIGPINGPAGEILDVRGLTVLPGVIDSQVHFREPGLEHKEDLASGSRAAVMGGVTAVFEMPNTKPLTTTAEAVADKIRRASGRMYCDFAFWVGATAQNIEQIPELERLPGTAGIKIFMGSSTGDLLVADDETLTRVLSKTRRRVAVHAEDESRLEARKPLREPGNPLSHPVWRDAEAALLATRRLVTIARATGARVHVLHVSTAEEMAFLIDHKDVASIEVTPHHLTLATDEHGRRLGTRMQMNPPVRDSSVRAALWRALDGGLVDVLGSDHAPHTLEEKAKAYPDSPSGMTGVQTLVPIMLDHLARGRLTLARFIDLTSAGPARLFGITTKGRIALGYDADFTVVDLKRQHIINNDWIASKAAWTPYHGQIVTGWPVGTIIRGRRAMWEGRLATAPFGRPVRFELAQQPGQQRA